MYVTMRRYEGIDKTRSEELRKKVAETLVPSLRELPGFSGYYLIDAGEGVLASIGVFENAKEAHESTRVAARWVREHELESALPKMPTIVAGPVLVHESRPPVMNGVPVFA